MLEKRAEGVVRLLGWSGTTRRLLKLSQWAGNFDVVQADCEFIELERMGLDQIPSRAASSVAGACGAGAGK